MNFNNPLTIIVIWTLLGAVMGVTVGLIINVKIPFYIDLLFGAVFGLIGGLVFLYVKVQSSFMLSIFVTVLGPRLALMIYDKISRNKTDKPKNGNGDQI